MFDFNQELKKFKPAVSVDATDDALYEDDLKDITDIVAEMVDELKNKSGQKNK